MTTWADSQHIFVEGPKRVHREISWTPGPAWSPRTLCDGRRCVRDLVESLDISPSYVSVSSSFSISIIYFKFRVLIVQIFEIFVRNLLRA